MALDMVQVPADEFARLRAGLRAATAEEIMATYGIGETTWRRIRKGEPIRRETLQRIVARYRATNPDRLSFPAD